MLTRKLESLIWIITGKCNLRCPYCYASRYTVEKELSVREARVIAREAGELGVEYLNITGGEPLLRRDLVEIVKLFVEHDVETSIFSNLTLASEDVISRLSRYIDFFLTSIDGPPEVYERVKGRGMWRRFLNGLELLRRYGISVHVNIPISKLNYKYVGEAVRQAVELGVESLSVIPAMPTGRALETKTYIDTREYIEALHRVDEVAREYGIVVSAWCTPFTPVLEGLKNVIGGNCREWNVLDITPSGKVVTCDVMGVEVADVLRDGLLGSWLKLEEYLRRNHVYEIPRECMRCPIASTCRGGCYARAYIKHGKLPTPDPLCPYTLKPR